MNRYLTTIIAAALCFAPVTVPAELLERDWQTSGDGLLTYDTATGLEWLDVTLTVNMSYNDVTAQLGTGGTYAGFVHASETQIVGLFDAVDLQEHPILFTLEGPKIALLTSFWGLIWDFGDGGRTAGLTANTTGLPADQHWAARVVWTELGQTGADATLDSFDDNVAVANQGSALVRIAATGNGDINQDGNVDAVDILLAQQIIGGLLTASPAQFFAGDIAPLVGGVPIPDGKFNAADLLLIQRLSTSDLSLP